MLKSIPGASYKVGDEDEFDETASQWLIAGNFIKKISGKKSAKPENSRVKDAESKSE